MPEPQPSLSLSPLARSTPTNRLISSDGDRVAYTSRLRPHCQQVKHAVSLPMLHAVERL
uniref:Uncharacterized protein n=1 Tax=Kalanchoe fedtschenkoi TaxID=63787 RepID=A0A7N0V220_KALFE